MSTSEEQDETREILEILSEDSILLLTKKLASSLNRARNGQAGKVTHLKIYEGLLSKRSSQDPDGDEILSLCIKNADHDAQTTNRLLKLIAQLSNVERGREIIQFLALMGSKKKQKNPEKQIDVPRARNVGIFHCPAEMLDGSRFAELSLQKAKDFYRTSFSFDAEPGSNLPQCSKFFRKNNKDSKRSRQQQPERKDQGYSSSEESEIDWVAVSQMGPPPRHRTWEQLGQNAATTEKPLLTDTAVIKTHTNQISRTEFMTRLGYMLIGVQSDSFPYCEERKSFYLAKDVQVVGISQQAVAEMVKPMIACGSSHVMLSKFVENRHERSRILQAIQKAVEKLLLVHRKSVQNLIAHHKDRVLALVSAMHWIGPPIVAVSAFCCPATGKRLKGLTALEELSKICSEIIPGRMASVFYSLLKAAAEAYLRILWEWIFEGDLPEGKKAEFMIQPQPGMLSRRDRAFWADSFVILETRVPSFMKGLEESVKECGIAISFLKLCQKNHPLLKLKNRPPVVCCLNDAELDRLKAQCVMYEQEAAELCGPPVTAAEQLEINQEQQQAFLAMVTRVREERLIEIRAALEKERKLKAERARKLKEELANQIEEVKARKAAQLKKEQEEEEKFVQELKELQEKQLKLLEEEKERMRRHYDMNSKEPEDKLANAEAEIQSLREELDFLTGKSIVADEDECDGSSISQQSMVNDNLPAKEDENKNPIAAEGQDDNANLSPRKVPTSLPIKLDRNKEDLSTIDNTAAIEAAKNKAKVLSHEYNLIQNYDECDSDRVAKNPSTLQDNQQLSEMFKLRADEAARNKARVMNHEFFSDFDQLDNAKKELLDNKTADASPMEELATPVEMFTSTDTENCEPLETPDTETRPSAMSISSEESKCGTPLEMPLKPFPASASSFSVSSIMSTISEPLRWQSVTSKESVNLSIKENSFDCSNHIKNSFLQHTVSVVLNTQVQLANQYVLHVFLHDQSILSHFKSLRKYFLLLDGEFATRLTSQLCTEIEHFQDRPGNLLNFTAMNLILQNALVGSEDPNKERLSLSFRSIPSKFNVADSNLLECIQLQYEVSWPLNSVLTRHVLQYYDLLFTFVLSLRRVIWVLDQTFRHLKTCDSGVVKKILNNSPQHRTLCQHHFEMSAFFRAFHSYILNVAIVQQWPKCEEAIKKVTSLDGLYEVHHKMFVRSVIYRCLLRKEAVKIQELLGATIRPVLRFYTLVIAHEWELKDDVYEHPQFKNLSLAYKKGYQSDLQDLCDYLRMNDFYSVLTVEPTQPQQSLVSSTASTLSKWRFAKENWLYSFDDVRTNQGNRCGLNK
ncbi:Hypothetical predicted protein [Cloeon dipterum]|uniref:Gamma-tubulin complex component n=1 Tax=Cloeon dipterum TaxID=197152 RepID=A0A8S1D5R9_9INSE|nr:Hypothetical predicted protein [Cloeon dipterum]